MIPFLSDMPIRQDLWNGFAITRRRDRCDGAMQAKRCRMTEGELAELEEIIRAHKIDEWNDFCKLDLCMCSGNSWTIHVTYRESRDEYIHAMGHSEAPDGFAEGKRAIEAFFERYL